MHHYIGMDMHRQFSQVCVLDAEGQTVRERRLYHEDVQEMTEFFAALAPGTPVAVEATYGWMWMADLLQGCGLQVHLAHPAGVRLIAESRLKTDKIDARILAQLLRTGFLPEAYLAPPPVRDLRMLLRHRQAMVKGRTSVKNAVHAVLARHNIHLPMSDVFGVAGTEMLAQMALPAPARRVLDDLLERIEFLNGQLRRLESHLHRALKPDVRIHWLTSLPGIGKLTAYYLLAEIGEIGRFCSAAKLASYAGLCPSTRASAGKVRHGPTGPAGRGLLKWALVEAAHIAVRRDPYFASVFQALQRRKGKQKAYVATARKMAVIVWQLLSEHRPYEHKRKQTQAGSRCDVAAVCDGAPLV
jgi:transposase